MGEVEGVDHRRRLDPESAYREADPLEEPRLPLCRGGVRQLQPFCEASLGHHSERHRLSVGPDLEPGRRLESVPDGMAVVQDPAQLGLLLVALDHLSFEAAGAGHNGLEGGQIPGEELRHGILQFPEIPRVQNDAVLDDLGQPGAELALGERGESPRIDDHHAGLMESADQVLASRVVDRGLAPDRRVHLGEKGGRNLDEIHAAHVRRGREASQVTHGAPAERHHGGATVAAQVQQAVPQGAGHIESFGLFSLRDVGLGHLEARLSQALPHRLRMETRDGRIGDEYDTAAHAAIGQLGTDRRQRSGPDQDRVRAGAEVDENLDQGRTGTTETTSL